MSTSLTPATRPTLPNLEQLLLEQDERAFLPARQGDRHALKCRCSLLPGPQLHLAAQLCYRSVLQRHATRRLEAGGDFRVLEVVQRLL